MTCGNDGPSFRDFLEQVSKTVATWPKWKREVLGDFPGSQDQALFVKELQGTWDVRGEKMAKTLQEDLKQQMAATDCFLGDPEGYETSDLVTWRNQRAIMAALVSLLDKVEGALRSQPHPPAHCPTSLDLGRDRHHERAGA
jgi:hypothetical protein